MANEFIIRKGYKSLAASEVTGSLTTTGNIIGEASGYLQRLYIQDKKALDSSSNFLYIDPNTEFSSGIYINNSVRIDGGLLGSYNEDLQLRTGTTTRITIANADGAVRFHNYGAGYLKTDSSGNITVDTSTIEDTLDSVTDRGATTTNSITTGDITIQDATPVLVLKDSNNGAGGSAEARILFSNTGGKAIAIGTMGDDDTSTDLYISSNAGSTYGGYLLLDSAGITDTQADIIIDPKTNFKVFTAGTEALDINTSQNATFAGDVTLSNGNALRWTSDDVRIEGTTAGDKIQFYVGGSEILKLEQSGTLSTFSGTVTAATSFIADAVSTSNNDPGSDNVQVSGYGMIGNRGNLYITNANTATTANVQIGVGGIHNGSPKLVVGATNSTFYTNVVPQADSTYSLGTTSLRWTNLYADNLYGDGSNLTGISTGPNYYLTGLSFATGTGVLTATVDGASNPTVDLDGRYRLDAGGELPSTTDLDTLTTTGIWAQNSNNQTSTSNNYPDGAGFAGIIENINDPGNNQHTSQMYFRYNGNNDIYHRYRYDSTNGTGGWSGWAKIWTTRNDGPTSGLAAQTAATASYVAASDIDGSVNADTLDSINSTQFLRSDESDTMSGNLSLEGNLLLTGTATTTNQGRMIDFTGFDKEGTTDFTDRAYIQHTTNTGGHAGSVLVISSQNDSGDGIAFLTNASSNLKHNSNTIWTSGNDGPTSGLAAQTAATASYYVETDTLDSVVERDSVTDNNITINSLLTNTDSTYTVGTNAVRFSDGYFDNLHVKTEIANNTAGYINYRSNQGHRFYIDANNDDTSHKFQILANTGSYNVNNVIFTMEQTGDATFTGDVNLSTAGSKLGIGMTATEVLDLKTTSGDCRIRLDAPASSDTEIKFFNAGVAQYTIGHDDATDNFVIGGTNVDAPLVSVGKTGNATFSGDVDALRFNMNLDYAASNEYLVIGKAQAQDGGIILKSKPTSGNAQNDWQILNHSSTGDLRFYAYGLGGFALTLDREDGNATFAGDVTVAGTLTAQEFHTEFVSASIVYESGSTKFGDTSDDNHDFTGSVNIDGTLTATVKSFDIVHPTQEGKRLIYGVLEGPEHAVYVRGESKADTVILPEEWVGLVDETSITAQFTPIGKPDIYYYEGYENNAVKVGGPEEKNYFYYIQATRRDVEPLITVQ